MASGEVARRGAAAHVFVDDLDEPVLSEDDALHLARSLRLRPGEEVTASDGRGRWRLTRWSGDGLDPVGEAVEDPPRSPSLTVGFALVKGDRPERIVRALTEIGIDALVPLVSARTVVRWEGDRGAHHQQRLERIMREAAMQSRRVRVPRLAAVTPVGSMGGSGVALAEPGGDPISLATPTVLVGPEGGWDPEERLLGPHVSLGPSILRAETAAVAAGVLLAHLRWAGGDAGAG